jgi:hypothetical protein
LVCFSFYGSERFPLPAANHFVGLLLWIPINKAMFTGDHRSSPDELEFRTVGVEWVYFTGCNLALRIALGVIFLLAASAHWGKRRADLSRIHCI